MNAQLMRHQKEAVDFALKNNGIAAFFHEVGCGKTLSALATFERLRQKEPSLKMLVICPISLIYGAWVREIEKFTSFTWFDFHAKKKKYKGEDIGIVNFEYFFMGAKFVKIRDWMADMKDVFCVIDESSRLKNYRSITTQRFFRHKKSPYRKWNRIQYELGIKDMAKYRVIMSGTPAPNIEWEYFPQMMFLDTSILGDNFYKFKHTHFSLHRGREVLPGSYVNKYMLRRMHQQGFKYQVNPEKRKEMFDKMKPWCHWIKAKDCMDLPEEIDEFRVVEMAPEQRRVYESMKKTYLAEIPPGESVAVANVILTKLMKLRQITSGFVIDDQNDAVSVALKNPKYKALMDIIEEMPQTQMIIWCHFHYEIDKLKDSLIDIGGVSQLHGRIKPNDRNRELEDFVEGKNQFMLAHPASAAHGLTMTNCHISIFFSLDYSMEQYTQARGRTMRKGQNNNCVYIHLIAKDSIDEDILSILQRKESARQVAERYLKNDKT